MSGHSKWSTIKRQKGAVDQKRGQTFTKIANNIALSAKLGGGDAESNPRLRLFLDQARAANMPKENVQRAIDRGLGKLPGQTFEEIHFEGFGPGKAAFIIEGVTDNKNRTLAEIRNLFDRSGGALGSNGSVAYMFDKKGLVKAVSKNKNSDEEELDLIDAGAEDIEQFEEDAQRKYLVYTNPASTNELSNKITQSGYQVESADVIYKPNTLVEVTDKETAERLLTFSEKLEEYEDIQTVSANFDIPDGLVQALLS